MAIITGTSGDDREPNELFGTELADQIYGLTGNDTLVGLGGDDLLEGGAGADELFGSGGLDLASYKASQAAVHVNLYDDLTGSASGGDAAGDRLFSVEGAIGSAYGDIFYGNGQGNVFHGGAGDDFLSGGAGDDVLEGGAGSDELWGGYGFDYASYQGSASPDGVYVLLSYADGTDFGDASGDRLYQIEGVIGSAFGDILQGNAGDNVLRGGGGDDWLSSLSGDDILWGEGGNDWLEGGPGNDVLEGGAGSDTAMFGSAPVVADLASGTAQGSYTGSDRLAGIENLLGANGDDRFAGDGGANALQGGMGADVLEGRGGADRFVYGQSYDSRAAAPDHILDFSRKQGDKIDLSGIDANEWGSGDPAFQFIGQDPFTAAGQVRFFKAGGDTVVEANTTDATAGAELTIMLDASLYAARRRLRPVAAPPPQPTRKGPAHARPHRPLRLRRPARAEPAAGAAHPPAGDRALSGRRGARPDRG